MIKPSLLLLTFVFPLPSPFVFHSLNTFSAPPTLDCPCSPDFAGPDQYICLGNDVVIGCNDGGSPECAGLCYEWAPAPGMPVSERMKKNPKVQPQSETVYSVSVSTVNGDHLGTSSVTVFVVRMEIVLYKPKVIAGNVTTLADPSRGAQTFLNIDNDDNDLYYDNHPDEPIGHGVQGGDDELVRVELKLQPDNLPDRFVKMIAPNGGNFIRVWQDEMKTAASEYILNTDIELQDRGNYLGIDLWVEGILPHQNQRQTSLSFTYQGTNICPTNAYLTVLSVVQVSWEGVNGNAANSTDVLDADPNFTPPVPNPPTWPHAVRIFPDARITNPNQPQNTARLNTRLAVAPVEALTMYVRSFDADDPVPFTLDPITGADFVDPNDAPGGVAGAYSGSTLTFTEENDNRTAGNKAGAFGGQNVAPIQFQANVATASILFDGFSMHPGDSYRAVVNGDVDFVNALENRDARDQHKIVHPGVLLPGPSPLEIQAPEKNASPVLTVWRRLHVERESMEGISVDHYNFIKRSFNDFSPNNSINILMTPDKDLRVTYDPNEDPDGGYLDPSAIPTTPTPCSGLGRFENGIVELLNGVGGLNSTQRIVTNTDVSIELMLPLLLTGAQVSFNRPNPSGTTFSGTATLLQSPTKMVAPGGNGFLYTWQLQNLQLDPPGTTLNDFITGRFKVNGAGFVQITNANVGNTTLETSGFQIRVDVKDDDALVGSLLPNLPPLQSLITIYRSVYLETIDLGGLMVNSPIFDPNIGDEMADFSQVAASNETIATEGGAFWCVHVISAFQGHTVKDFDGQNQTPGLSICPIGPSSIGYEYGPLLGETEPAILHDSNISNGGDHSFIYREVIREASTVVNEALTVTHEIGHQFGLSHGDYNPAAPIPEWPNTMGLMSAGGTAQNLIPRHKNLIRSRTQSPGGH